MPDPPHFDPETEKHYDPDYVKIFTEKIRPRLQQLSETQEEVTDHVEKARVSAKNYLQVHEELHLTLPKDSYKDDIEVINDTFPSIDGKLVPIKIYKPKKIEIDLNVAYINFHGGGFSAGTLDNDSHINYHVAKYAGATVFDVGYRLVPEWTLATAFYDCFAAIKYVKDNHSRFGIDIEKVAIGGTSAGGKIALVAAHLFRDLGSSIALVSANVPPVENMSALKKAEDSNFESVMKFNNELGINFNIISVFENLCSIGEKQGKIIDPESVTSFFGIDEKVISKYIETSTYDLPNFKGLQKHIVFVGDHDALKDAGKKYANTLIKNEVDVSFGVAKGLGHGHAGFSNVIPEGRKYIDLLTSELKSLQKSSI